MAADSDRGVATLLVPGEDDLPTVMKGGGASIDWALADGTTRKVTKFRENKMEQLRQDDLALPDLYLHTLNDRFMIQEGEYSLNMRSGNDNSELMLALPSELIQKASGLDPETKEAFTKIMDFLSCQGEVMASDVKAAGSLLNTKYAVKLNRHRLNFKMKTSRPKAGISLPKKLFGIPEEADTYLFMENHISVNFMSEQNTEDLEKCITEFSEHADQELRDFSIFLKVFHEGGFAYNKKKVVEGGYVPVNLAITSLGISPAFEGQIGIGTGYPYVMKPQFLPFTDTVPVTIGGIAGMSERHSRYGLCFTRCVHVWESVDFHKEGVLDFCSVLPHGGFYYVPKTLQKHLEIGGLIYAFGESKEARGEAGNETAT